VRAVTPRTLYNRPGLPAIGYRVGRYADFFESMIARLASRPELVGYTTRDLADPGIALIDCWALTGDIVTWYAERAANEGYLSTATQAGSLSLLAALVDYQPRPPLGASGYLAFTMAPGATGVIPAGTQARSVAAQNQLPQTFETAEAITAQASWNQLAVRQTQPSALSATTADDKAQLTVTGTATGVQPGTRLVFDFPLPAQNQPQPQQVRVVTGVTADYQAGQTVLQLVPVSPQTPVGAATVHLNGSIRQAQDAASKNDLSGQLVAGVLHTLDQYGENSNFDAVATLARELTEWLAITANRVQASVAAWLAGPVTVVLNQAGLLLGLLAAEDRRLLPGIAYLQQLAAKLTGGDGAAPLATAAAIVPALQLAPSQPPATATALPQTTTAALDPGSAAATALLAAADPRLSGVLTQAIGHQAATPPPATAGVIALTTKASVPAPQDDDEARTSNTQLVLDGTLSSLVPGGWLVTEQQDEAASPFVNQIVSVQTYTVPLALAAVGGSGGAAAAPAAAPVTYLARTKVTLSGVAWSGDGRYPFQDLTAYYGNSALQLAGDAITAEVCGSQLELAQNYDGLYPGQRLVVTGERTDIPGTPGITASELTMVGGVQQQVNTGLAGDATLPVLTLATPLAYTYQRATVTISGNVALATQGATTSEVLGSGTAAQAGQVFTVKQVSATSPLTYLPSGNALGAADTLTVRVNGMAWQETGDLSQASPSDTEYTVVPASDGTLSVAFGDGVHGARLPTGPQNVTATYRTGAGSGGNLAAGQVSQLASRPLGVTAVTNPLPTTGGADGDAAADLRGHAAIATLALDRLVSVQDYADFTAARAGIGKAASAGLSDGSREVIYVTIAGVDDAPVDVSDLLVTDLAEALAELGDPYLPVQVGVRDLLLLVMSAGIKVGAAYSYDLVEPAVRAAALAAGGFAAHGFGQPVYLSEIISAMQAVPGVEYVDVDLFTALPGTADPVPLLLALLTLTGAGPSVRQVITVQPARFEQDTVTVGTDPTGVPDTLTSIAVLAGTTIEALAALNPALTSITLQPDTQVTVASGIQPAQLALFSPDVPQTLLLRSIP
jgi:predicted phage baseplate assembly protein